MNLSAVVPLPCRIALLCAFALALVAFGWVKGAHHVQAKWDAAEGTRAKAVTGAVLARVAENKQLANSQAAISTAIQETKDHEIADLKTRLAAAGRMRVGPAICGGARPAAPAQAQSTGSGDSADPPQGMVRDDVDRDLKALILAVETDLATGRACQAFLHKNGLVP
jgi:hypothetical protein